MAKNLDIHCLGKYDEAFFSGNKPFLSELELQEIEDEKRLEAVIENDEDDYKKEYDDYIESLGGEEALAYQDKLINDEYDSYVKIYNQYLLLISQEHNLTSIELESYVQDIPCELFNQWELERENKQNDIYSFQFKFVEIFNQWLDFFFKNKYLYSKYYASHKIIKLPDLLDFLGIAIKDIQKMQIIANVNEESIRQYSDSLINCQIFIDNFFRYSDYNEVSIPTIKFLLNNNFFEDLQSLINSFKRKLIQSYLYSDSRFKDFKLLKEFSNNDFWDDNFVSCLKAYVIESIKLVEEQNRILFSEDLCKALSDYLVNAKKSDGDFIKGKKGFLYPNLDTVKVPVIKKALLDLSEDEAIRDEYRFRFRRYYIDGRINRKKLVHEMFGNKYTDDKGYLDSFILGCEKVNCTRELVPILIEKIY